MLDNEKAKEYCRKCVFESNADDSRLLIQPADDNSQKEDITDLETKGNSETVLTAFLTLAGIEGKCQESRQNSYFLT